MLVLDSGGVSRLAEHTRQAAAIIMALRDRGLWPPVVPAVVLVECLEGHVGRDALTNRFLKTCDVVEEVGEPLARRDALRCCVDVLDAALPWTRSLLHSPSRAEPC